MKHLIPKDQANAITLTISQVPDVHLGRYGNVSLRKLYFLEDRFKVSLGFTQLSTQPLQHYLLFALLIHEVFIRQIGKHPFQQDLLFSPASNNVHIINVVR
ncbi:MAG TPA: hypothetical protein VFW11_08150 [Cyclobacteriaceae bacterium]|nr:hypothetical protein [Cyclobacteriaceae bacterium]